MEEKLSKYIRDAKRLLITSHVSPDPDAVSSVLLLGRTIKLNFPEKQVRMVLEEIPIRDLSFLAGYDELEFESLTKAASSFQPDLFIMTDANSYGRVSRIGSQELLTQLEKMAAKTVIIDHHEDEDKDLTNVFINNRLPSCAQEIYSLLFEKLGLKKPDGYAETALLGIISDSLRFMYDNPTHRETFRIVSELLEAGASIEKLENRLDRYSKEQLLVLGELAANLAVDKDYNYSYISDDFAKRWQKEHKSVNDYKAGAETFVNDFIRNTGENTWGFIIYPELIAGTSHYAASFRALGGTVDVSAIARRLGGGGHKPAAGAKITAKSIKEALAKVEQAIKASGN